MKKFKRIAYVLLIVILVVLSLFIYSNASKDDEQNQKEKTFSQIQYIEYKIMELSNAMNQIQAQNYSVTAGELSKQATQQSSQSSTGSEGESQGEGTNKGESQESGSEGGSSGNEQSGSGSESSTSQEQDKKEFNLEPNGILINNQQINWKEVKSEVENLYASFPTITIDLYEFNVNQEDILAFNKEYDNLTTVVKEENKEETLAQLAKIYGYLPKFLRVSNQDELEITLAETKENVLKAYSKLDKQNWEEIGSDIQNAIDQYAKLLSDTSIDASKQYNINKGYIILNELKNAVAKQDISVFLIKYKNLLEEINNV